MNDECGYCICFAKYNHPSKKALITLRTNTRSQSIISVTSIYPDIHSTAISTPAMITTKIFTHHSCLLNHSPCGSGALLPPLLANRPFKSRGCDIQCKFLPRLYRPIAYSVTRDWRLSRLGCRRLALILIFFFNQNNITTPRRCNMFIYRCLSGCCFVFKTTPKLHHNINKKDHRKNH